MLSFILGFEAAKTRGPNSIQNKGLPSSCKKPGLFITRYLANAIIDCGEIDPNEDSRLQILSIRHSKTIRHRMVPFAGPKIFLVKPGAFGGWKTRGQIYNPEIPHTPMSQWQTGWVATQIFRIFTPDPWGNDRSSLIFFKWVVQPPTCHPMSQWQKLQALSGWTAAWPETFWKKTANRLDGPAPSGVMEVSNFDCYGKWWKYGIMC